jgi:site-specific DNA-methyltransferase (adenine-specific)
VNDGRRPGRKATATSNFGVSRRENHDASDFYARFSPPVLSSDTTVNQLGDDDVDWIHHGDARAMDDRLKASSVALVVTSPPYFAGKAYEEELGQGHIPADYVAYLDMLRSVFAACVEVLEPGGRIAVNVANLGRKPYRSLAADVVSILQDDLGLLLRGEVIWRKAEGSTGSCAWGSFQSASNPVLRDLTERVVIASKGRFDRAVPKRERAKRGLPSEDTIFKDDFMTWTTDVWDIPTESAVRVGHPAPFPVELPRRLIELYTYKGDVVLDPFMGSGSSAVAAVQTDRHFVGFDTDADYIARASQRIAEARVERAAAVTLDEPLADRPRGPMAKEVARALLDEAGFAEVAEQRRLGNGIEVAFTARDQRGRTWAFDLAGSLTKGYDRAGLRRTDSLWKAIGRATVLHETLPDQRVVLLTPELPPRGSVGATTLKSVRGGDKPLFDAVELTASDTAERLAAYATGTVDAPTTDLYPPAR